MKYLFGFCTFVLLLALAAGCKKEAATNELSGNWKVINVTGNVTSTTGADTGHYTYSYNPSDSLLSYTVITSHAMPLTYNNQIYETWNFISADTCSISYTYIPLNQPMVTGNNHGAYTLSGSNLFLAAGASQLLIMLGIDAPPYPGIYDQFKIQNVSSSQLVLNYNAVVNDSNSVAQVNFTLTFSK
jgi:hypothetical protein